MDKLDLMNSYEMIEQIKDYLAKSSCGYKIIQEEATDDVLILKWESENGKDGLPQYLYDGGKIIFKGVYVLEFNIKNNYITFWYIPAGTYERRLSSWFVGMDNDGKPVYKEIKTKISIMTMEKEWNDNFQNYGLGVKSYAYKSNDGSETYLAFEFHCRWILNESDTLDSFITEFLEKTMATCQSQKMANFIENRIFSYMVPGRSL